MSPLPDALLVLMCIVNHGERSLGSMETQPMFRAVGHPYEHAVEVSTSEGGKQANEKQDRTQCNSCQKPHFMHSTKGGPMLIFSQLPSLSHFYPVSS